MAAGDLTTLANVKQWINVGGSADDALLTRLVTAVSNFIQTWLNRQLNQAVYVETYDGPGGNRLMLSNYPVTAVASVTVDGQAIPVSTIGASGISSGFTFDQYGVVLRGGGYSFDRSGRPANVIVTYTAGYSVLPVEIEQAAIELISLRFAERRRPGVSSQSIAGENVTYRDVGMTDSIASLLLQYKKVVPV